jgi:hypothetical protein
MLEQRWDKKHRKQDHGDFIGYFLSKNKHELFILCKINTPKLNRQGTVSQILASGRDRILEGPREKVSGIHDTGKLLLRLDSAAIVVALANRATSIGIGSRFERGNDDLISTDFSSSRHSFISILTV